MHRIKVDLLFGDQGEGKQDSREDGYGRGVMFLKHGVDWSYHSAIK
jgi:hypothetical protein